MSFDVTRSCNVSELFQNGVEPSRKAKWCESEILIRGREARFCTWRRYVLIVKNGEAKEMFSKIDDLRNSCDNDKVYLADCSGIGIEVR